MAWGSDDRNQGPWGRASGSSGGGAGGGGKGGKGGKAPSPGDPDFEAWFAALRARAMDFLSRSDGPNGVKLVVLALAAVWVLSGVYLVKADEQGVVMRLGKYERTTSPGMGYHLPYPIETVYTPRVTTVNRVEVGSAGRGGRAADSLMLTGDENIVDVQFEVQWKIGDAAQFLFQVRNAEETVRSVAESAMREVMGRTSIAAVMAEGRLGEEQARMELASRQIMQEMLNAYQAGVEVVNVNITKVDPPAQVIDAFRDVQSARADFETARNQAQAYRNDITPRARGEARKMELEAEAYQQEVVARATGEAARFQAVYQQYQTARDATKKRLYLETMEEVLQGMPKVIVEKQAGGVVPVFPLNDLKSAAGGRSEAKP